MGTRTSTFGRVCFLNVFFTSCSCFWIFGILVFFVFVFVFCSHLGFYWCKKCDRGKKEGRGPGSVLYVDWFLFIIILSCVATECSGVQCPVSSVQWCQVSRIPEFRDSSAILLSRAAMWRRLCVKTTFEED